ncbi:helix-turn-helix domain-containing protein [Paenimyroides baculatum]|uniref:Helix-turn-helix domain-containing protein n=1 Tax=Paenimyroides baculatum TaxID=2608000 RepID=A0A5M6CKC7_9FLAO|nr:helix-turn-helix domain-containing protein [Paenimyroides baculatum]KAA5535584.1 helix-turn-helix domain-containing protein [Paenimyroides baculatum]
MSKLKQLREQKNMTQEELSEQSGISVRTIQRIESGTNPKGHTLKTLSKSLDISENELLDITAEIEPIDDEVPKILQLESAVDFGKVKLINLSSILFVVLPPLNIIAPLVLSYVLKQRNPITKQIVSLQILWTILAPVFFMFGIFLKLGRSFTIVVLFVIALSNIYLILRNSAELDRNKKLHYRLNFNLI